MRPGRAARNHALETREFFLRATRDQLDIARRRVLHPASNAECGRVVMDEPPESNPLHPANDPEVDDRHLRTG